MQVYIMFYGKLINLPISVSSLKVFLSLCKNDNQPFSDDGHFPLLSHVGVGGLGYGRHLRRRATFLNLYHCRSCKLRQLQFEAGRPAASWL